MASGDGQRVIERVWVVGAGAIGSLFAAHLARVCDVSVLCRREEHARALSQRGLRVSGRHEFTATPRASSDPSALPPFDLAIVATKATELDGASSLLAGHSPARPCRSRTRQW